MTYAFNLSQFANNVDSTGKAILTSGQAVTGILPVANGGTGASGFTNPAGVTGQVLLGSGTSSFGTVAPGASGNLLTSNGTTWTSAAAPITGQNVVVYNANGTWTVPSGVTKAIVYVYGSGGNGLNWYSGGSQYTAGGAGGYICAIVTGLTGTISLTIAAGNSGASTTTFGGAVTATGGTTGIGGGSHTPGTNGSSSYANVSGMTVTPIAQGVCGINMVNTDVSLEKYNLSNLYDMVYQPIGILGGTGYGRPGIYNNSMYIGGGGAIAIQY